MEKLDDQRVRFKRPVSARERDSLLPEGVDPYRSYFGMQPRQFVFIMLSIVLGVFLIVFISVAIAIGLLGSNIFHP